jgi:hypothetical protein
MQAPRLPKQVLDEPGAARLASELVARAQPLWRSDAWRATRAELTPGVEAALRSAHSAGRIVRGLESAERTLATEQRGLENVDRTTGVDRGGRVSRLLVLADDGSERFYRSVEFVLRRHAPRVLALRLAAGEQALGRLLFGPDQVARALLIQHKEAVSALLLALADDWRAESRA